MIMLKIYKFISIILSPIIFLLLVFRLALSKEKIQSIREKFSLYKNTRPKGKLIWINGVSIGEAKTAITVANEIKKNNPDCIILLTTSTSSSYDLISKMKINFKLVYAPLDISYVVNRFLTNWKPSLTIFIESEVWPNIFWSLKKRSIKLKIFNARMSKKSYTTWKRFNFFAKQIFCLIDVCFVQDFKSKERFKRLGVKNVKKIENIKFLSKELDVDNKKYVFLKNKLKNKRIVTFFSSHKGEEELFLDCFDKLEKKIKNLFFVIIPRHLDRIDNIVEIFNKKGRAFNYRDNLESNIIDNNPLIVNSMGELGLFFKLSEIAVVGGSFSNRGGHNPIETQSFNCSVIFGPHMENFKEIKDLIVKNNAGFEVKNLNGLIKKINAILKNKKLNERTYKNFEKLCFSFSNKSRNQLKFLLK